MDYKQKAADPALPPLADSVVLDAGDWPFLVEKNEHGNLVSRYYLKGSDSWVFPGTVLDEEELKYFKNRILDDSEFLTADLMIRLEFLSLRRLRFSPQNERDVS